MKWVISNSDRSTFKNCRRKWDLSSPNRQNLSIRNKQGPLWLGSLVHLCLEDFYGGIAENTFEAFKSREKEISPSERSQYEKLIELTEVMMRHYSLVYPSLIAEPFEVVHTEYPFQIGLNDRGDIFAGTIDGVIRWKDSGRIAILEHKTFSMHKDPKLHGIDDQTSIYPAALNALIAEDKVPGCTRGDFCDSVLYNGLWKKVPSEVKLLKSGELSKNAFTNTTPHWVEYSRRELGLEIDVPLDTLDSLVHNVEKFFPRFEIPRGEAEQRLAVNRLLGEFKEMSRPDLELYHNPTTECTWKCPFLEICEAQNVGADFEIIKKGLCEKSPSRGEAYE